MGIIPEADERRAGTGSARKRPGPGDPGVKPMLWAG